MKKKTSVGSKIILTLTMLFFYLPILYIIIFSFNDSRSLTKFGGFSLRWYEKMFADSTMMEAVLYTVIIAVIATVVATVVGTITAIGLSKSRKVVQKMVERINDLPVMNPDIVTAISLLMFFSVLTVKKGFGTLLIAHIMFCIPYVMLSVTPKLRSLDPNLIDAAMDLGATPFQALAKVIVPQIKPGIVSGALIAFTMSFDDFVISYFTTGNGVNNISILVYTMSKRVNPSINALSTIVILLITLVLGVVNIVPIVREKREKDGKSSRAVSRKAMAAVAAVLVLAVVGGTVGARLSQQHKSAAAVEKYGSNVLKLYLPGEYLGENVISDFEKQYGVRVIVENFDSNEMMYTKLMAGDRYDVIIPSDYMIERLMNEDFLQPLDKSMIPNMENMSDAVLGMSYDPDNTYSIPYFWGSVGLVYNHENVDPAVIESEGWEVLRNTDYAGHIYIYDSERDSFMMAFKALGYSMNTEDPNEINDAYEWLLQMNNTMSPVYVTDEVIDGMMNGYKDIAVVYSGDAAVVLDENEDMSFYMPSQGTNIWCDAMVIPQNAENPKLAHEFINYMLTYEAAFDNTETVGYTSPNAEVFEEMTSSEDLYADNAAYLPRSGYDKDEMFHDNQTLMRELSKLWIKVKAAK
ncbi:extracellular solute-binding protein [Ruminococcaceae bacterium TF06-43]|mgnify:FL=1|jgi:spermidine/putrescine ABC transporter, spermidine/putrescine-binding protein|nr:extracellular solute-binding protein [Bacillota bacterium]RHU70464.1 extracellular solute-binding protein [Ruminococcaceae bacterium TF06-43]HJH83343.1 extracellular solute-binding protein [Clostridiales bacterium]